MTGYTKLFGSILESTVWLESPPIKVVWITLLAMADRDGIIEASVPGLAKRAGVERGHCEQALAVFLAPDPDSRTQDFEGRRVEVVPGGWRLLNHDVYRERASKEDMRERAKLRQRRKRERAAKPILVTGNVTDCHASSRLEAKSHAIAEAPPSPPPPPPQDRTERDPVARATLQGGGVMAGMLPRDHLNCRPPCIRVCLSQKQHAILREKHGGNDAALDAFYAEVRSRLSPDVPIVEKPCQFWDAQFTAKFTETASVRPKKDWWAECQELHGGTCTKQWDHGMRMKERA